MLFFFFFLNERSMNFLPVIIGGWQRDRQGQRAGLFLLAAFQPSQRQLVASTGGHIHVYQIITADFVSPTVFFRRERMNLR